MLNSILQLDRQLQEAHLLRGIGGGVDKSELKSLPLSSLEGLRQQLRRDLDHLDAVSQPHTTLIKSTNYRVLPSPTEHPAEERSSVFEMSGVPSLRSHSALPALCAL